MALLIAFAFEVVNGFHDTANAVTTVIYTRTLRPMPAVFFSGFCNFLGVLLGGTAIAFSIVHLLPVDLLTNATSKSAIIMVLALLSSGMAWNLSTWWLGLPVSSSHTLIGAILGIGLANSLLTGEGLLGGVNWSKAGEVGLALLISPLLGFLGAAGLLLASKRLIPDPELYVPPPADGAATAPLVDPRDPGRHVRRRQPGPWIERRTEGDGPDHAGADRAAARQLMPSISKSRRAPRGRSRPPGAWRSS